MRPGTPGAAQGLRSGTWRDVAYKGDWMRRPIASNEVAWLVRLLLPASDALNRTLGLGAPLTEDEPAPPASQPFAVRMGRPVW